jgi:hypothetical protein
MTAVELLEHCRAAGVCLSAGPSGTLAWECDVDPPAALLAALSAQKAEVLRLLTVPPADLSLLDLPPDLFETWQERVCIMHYDGQLPWKQAEALALADVLRRAGPAQEPCS